MGEYNGFVRNSGIFCPTIFNHNVSSTVEEIFSEADRPFCIWKDSEYSKEEESNKNLLRD